KMHEVEAARRLIAEEGAKVDVDEFVGAMVETLKGDRKVDIWRKVCQYLLSASTRRDEITKYVVDNWRTVLPITRLEFEQMMKVKGLRVVLGRSRRMFLRRSKRAIVRELVRVGQYNDLRVQKEEEPSNDNVQRLCQQLEFETLKLRFAQVKRMVAATTTTTTSEVDVEIAALEAEIESVSMEDGVRQRLVSELRRIKNEVREEGGGSSEGEVDQSLEDLWSRVDRQSQLHELREQLRRVRNVANQEEVNTALRNVHRAMNEEGGGKRALGEDAIDAIVDEVQRVVWKYTNARTTEEIEDGEEEEEDEEEQYATLATRLEELVNEVAEFKVKNEGLKKKLKEVRSAIEHRSETLSWLHTALGNIDNYLSRIRFNKNERDTKRQRQANSIAIASALVQAKNK
ncbi:MAG: hypothetical protein EBZ77_16645, partial [Chitinophagia bacterium]|nr:hypothetical protein [Chitinophagia bacterium]